ncbi:MAG: molybdenum cofactor guanylyltransferase, partial [Acidobacteriota bacterium]
MLTGAILAGGKSRRYGRNKAFELFQGKRMIDGVVESLRPLCDPVMVVANDLSLYLDVRATLIQDFILDQGPLVGVYTALLFSPNDWVFVKATDMPVLVPDVVEMMVAASDGFDAVVPICEGKYEPL